MVYEDSGDAFLVISSIFVAVGQDRSIIEFWDIDFVADRTTVAASVDSERILREAHFELKNVKERIVYELLYVGYYG